MKKIMLAGVLLPIAISFAKAQIKRTSVPMGEALTKALNETLLTGPGAHPFHIRIVVSDPENPQSPYLGVIEEWCLARSMAS
jgi:hypothetical protein